MTTRKCGICRQPGHDRRTCHKTSLVHAETFSAETVSGAVKVGALLGGLAVLAIQLIGRKSEEDLDHIPEPRIFDSRRMRMSMH